MSSFNGGGLLQKRKCLQSHDVSGGQTVISLKNNFQSKNFQYFLYYNCPEYDDACTDEVIQVTLVHGFDILILYKFCNNEDAKEREDKKDLKFELLEQQHEGCNNGQPDAKHNWSNLGFFHAGSC
jgi:hypothetical protein